MKVNVLLLAFLIFVLAGGGMVMAHGGGQTAPSTSSLNGQSGSNMAGMDMNGKDKNMDMSGNQNMKDSKSSNDMQEMNMGEEPIKETPPNAKVLGTYGAVNAAFIIIGVWNKWFRRKDGSDGNTK